MTSPPESIHVTCEHCGHAYDDWYRASLNLELDDFDDEYMHEATSTTCPQCGHCVDIDVLFVTKDLGK